MQKSCISSCLLTLSFTQIQKRDAGGHKIICRTVLSSVVGLVDKSEEKNTHSTFLCVLSAAKKKCYCWTQL